MIQSWWKRWEYNLFSSWVWIDSIFEVGAHKPLRCSSWAWVCSIEKGSNLSFPFFFFYHHHRKSTLIALSFSHFSINNSIHINPNQNSNNALQRWASPLCKLALTSLTHSIAHHSCLLFSHHYSLSFFQLETKSQSSKVPTRFMARSLQMLVPTTKGKSSLRVQCSLFSERLTKLHMRLLIHSPLFHHSEQKWTVSYTTQAGKASSANRLEVSLLEDDNVILFFHRDRSHSWISSLLLQASMSKAWWKGISKVSWVDLTGSRSLCLLRELPLVLTVVFFFFIFIFIFIFLLKSFH